MFFIGTSVRTNNEVYSKIPLQQMKKVFNTCDGALKKIASVSRIQYHPNP